ncbi:MAG: DMT family transporter [Cyanobacteriota bacterium]|nr:DMT family transporter [Cyanobacteriota bacterium]
MTEELQLTSQATATRETPMALTALFADLVIIAFLPILLKVSEYEISPDATIFNRFWIATVILGLWNGVEFIKGRWSANSTPVKLLPDSTNLLLLLLMGVLSGGQQLLYARSLTQTTVANSEVLHSLTPLFTTLVGWTFLGQKFDGLFSIGIAIAVLGSIALAANDFSIALDKLQGDGLALVSAAFWGGYLMVTEKLRSQFSIRAIATWNCLLITFFTLPFVLAGGEGLFPHSETGWLTLSALGISAIFTTFLITYSLKRLSSGLVATILLLHPAITAMLAWGIFNETLSLLNLLAFVVILFGAYLTTSSKAGVKETEE